MRRGESSHTENRTNKPIKAQYPDFPCLPRVRAGPAAKWVAKLRASKTDTNQLLLRTYMHGSHGGVSGRYKRYEQTAFVYAFILDLMGLEK